MNRNRIKQIGMLLLIAALISSGIQINHSHAAEPNSSYEKVWTTEPPTGSYTAKIGQVTAMTFSLDMWHYSGGYWKVGNKGAEQITIQDDKFKQKDVSQIVANTKAEFAGELPTEVKTEWAKGNRIIPYIKPRTDTPLNAMFDAKTPPEFKIEDGKLTFSARPIFSCVDTNKISFNQFLNPKPNEIIPFVDPAYGYNIYSVFGNGANARQVNGWINKADPGNIEGMPAGRIHPSMVKDVTGALKSGYQIMIDGALKDSAGYSIGQGTFNNAGACGLHFEYPVEFIFYAAPDVPECAACGDELISGTDETACSATSCGDWEKPECGCTVIADPVVLPPSTSGCNSVITWSEADSSATKHTYKCSGCKTRKKTGTKYCPGHECPHTYTYEATLTADAALTPSTLKSGYGFEVKATYSVATKQTKNAGKCGKSLIKANEKKPTAPTKAEVRAGWVYKNEFGNQPKIIGMEKISGVNAFEMKKNNLSPQKSRKVFTAIELAGTKTKPAKHNVDIVLAGGGVSGVAEFCKTLTKQITINGNMYEDDHTSGGGW